MRNREIEAGYSYHRFINPDKLPFVGGAPSPFMVVDMDGKSAEVSAGRSLPYSIEGQGSYPQGAARELVAVFPKYFDIASEVTRKDILYLAVEGSREDLTLTDNAQIVTAAYTLACMDIMERVIPDLKPPFVIAKSLGLWIGAYRADVFGDHKNPDSLTNFYRLLDTRSVYMRRDCDRVPGGLANISVQNPADWRHVDYLMRKHGIEPAFYLDPLRRRVGGERKELENWVKEVKEAGFRAGIMKNVSGAFHTSNFKWSEGRIRELLRDTKLYRPSIPLVSNTSPTRLIKEESEIREELWRISTSPVNEEGMTNLTRSQGYRRVYRVGQAKSFDVDLDISPIMVATMTAAIGTVAWRMRTRKRT